MRDLTMTYTGVRALDSVDLVVPTGTVMALLGPNGAGKTTAVRIIATLLAPSSGSVSVAGVDAIAAPHTVRGLIGLSGQFAAVDPSLTGIENLTMVARLAGYNRRASRRRALTLLEQFDIADAGPRRVATYSGGMRRRLDLAGALVAHPPVIILDEPTAGLDPNSRAQLWSAVRELVAAGSTVLLTTQYLEEADQLADSVTVIDHGAVIARGTPDDLKKEFGTAFITLRLSDRADRPRAADVIVERGFVLIDSADAVDDVTFEALNPGQAVAVVIGALAVTGISVVDSRVRIPSLDDVFIDLTASSTEVES